MTTEVILTEGNINAVAEWCVGRVVVQHDALDDSVTIPGLNVRIWDGSVQRAQIGDTLIRQIDGSFRIEKKHE